MPKTDFNSKVENNKAIISFNAKDYVTYNFKANDKVLKSISNKNGEQIVTIDLLTPKQTITIDYFYTLSPEINNTDKINFIKTNKTNISKDKWFI